MNVLLALLLAADLGAAEAAREAGDLERAIRLVDVETPDAGISLDALALRAALNVERGETDAARADFTALLDADPDYELPVDETRRVRGFFRLVKVGRSGPVAEPAAPSEPAEPTTPEVAPSVKRPNTLAIEEPTSLDVLWWTVAGVSAGALLVTLVLTGVAVAAPPNRPSTSLGRIELPLR